MDDRVATLVYIAALAPDADETSQSQQQKFPVTDVFSHIEVADGRIWLKSDGVGIEAPTGLRMMPTFPRSGGKTSPISAVDVARAVSVVLEDPTPHIGQIYNLTGFESADLEYYARAFSKALGRTIRYRDVPLSGWSEKLLGAGVPAHTVKHLSVMTELNKQGRYDRMTDDLFRLTGQKPISMHDFVKLHAAEFTRPEIKA